MRGRFVPRVVASCLNALGMTPAAHRGPNHLQSLASVNCQADARSVAQSLYPAPTPQCSALQGALPAAQTSGQSSCPTREKSAKRRAAEALLAARYSTPGLSQGSYGSTAAYPAAMSFNQHHFSSKSDSEQPSTSGRGPARGDDSARLAQLVGSGKGTKQPAAAPNQAPPSKVPRTAQASPSASLNNSQPNQPQRPPPLQPPPQRPVAAAQPQGGRVPKSPQPAQPTARPPQSPRPAVPAAAQSPQPAAQAATQQPRPVPPRPGKTPEPRTVAKQAPPRSTTRAAPPSAQAKSPSPAAKRPAPAAKAAAAKSPSPAAGQQPQQPQSQPQPQPAPAAPKPRWPYSLKEGDKGWRQVPACPPTCECSSHNLCHFPIAIPGDVNWKDALDESPDTFAVHAIAPDYTCYTTRQGFKIYLVSAARHAEDAIKQLRASMRDPLIAIDLEWKPEHSAGALNKVAVLQLGSANTCVIFHTSSMNYKLPDAVKTFMCDKDVILLGFGWASADEAKLKRSFDFGKDDFGNFVDLQATMNVLGYRYNQGLKDTTQNVLGVEFRKSKTTTRSNWATAALNRQQIRYAALDVISAGAVFRGLRLWHAHPELCPGCRVPVGMPVENTFVCPETEREFKTLENYTRYRQLNSASVDYYTCGTCHRIVKKLSGTNSGASSGTQSTGTGDGSTGTQVKEAQS